MNKKKITANFFWNQKKLNIYDYACLKSFIKNNFDVNVYSYVKIKLPKGANLRNASIILKKKEINKFIHEGKRGCLAAFADKFRIELQKRKHGWWFDMDVLCLKDASYFKELEKGKKFIIGFEDSHKVNNAVLKINDKNLINNISNEISKVGYVINWGAIGPKLITRILKNNNLISDIIKKDIFYPVNYIDFNNLLLPEKLPVMKKNSQQSLTCHIYNQILNRFGIPKNIMPTKGSFLHEEFIKYCPEFKNADFLPYNTIRRLLDKKNGFKENITDLLPSLFRALR
jgi:hypothetical protein